MRAKYPYLMALAKRMVPGAFEDPHRIIGTCRYCDGDVTYAAGDTDRSGRARHDACEKEVSRGQLDCVRAGGIFRSALALVRDLPAVAPHAVNAIRAMPDRYGAIEMAGFMASVSLFSFSIFFPYSSRDSPPKNWRSPRINMLKVTVKYSINKRFCQKKSPDLTNGACRSPLELFLGTSDVFLDLPILSTLVEKERDAEEDCGQTGRRNLPGCRVGGIPTDQDDIGRDQDGSGFDEQ